MPLIHPKKTCHMEVSDQSYTENKHLVSTTLQKKQISVCLPVNSVSQK